VARWAEAVGPDDLVVARLSAPNSLRAQLGDPTSVTISLSAAAARADVAWLFGGRVAATAAAAAPALAPERWAAAEGSAALVAPSAMQRAWAVLAATAPMSHTLAALTVLGHARLELVSLTVAAVDDVDTAVVLHTASSSCLRQAEPTVARPMIRVQGEAACAHLHALLPSLVAVAPGVTVPTQQAALQSVLSNAGHLRPPPAAAAAQRLREAPHATCRCVLAHAPPSSFVCSGRNPWLTHTAFKGHGQ
jgi:hypothetical protein